MTGLGGQLEFIALAELPYLVSLSLAILASTSNPRRIRVKFYKSPIARKQITYYLLKLEVVKYTHR